MYKIYILVLLIFLINYTVYAQSNIDSVQRINEVIVTGYLFDQTLIRTPASVSIIDNRQIKQQPGNSFVPLLNTVPGLRMEERSPGSYRLSIRGSLLRSPFGIRNVKVYLDEFPLTDAGGNTYLNLLDVNSITGIEVLKGPDGSLFGANSGGVVLINPFNKGIDSNIVSADIGGGSYGLFRENVTLKKEWSKYQIKINQSHQQSAGYRANSSLQRNYLQTVQRWNYSPKNEIKVLLLYSDLNYLTPGGLTAAQQDINPQDARPATKTLPGAVKQKAGIYNRTFFGGVLHEARFTDRLRHVISVFESQTDFKNPFITNYEVRDENSLGLRTYFELSGQKKAPLDWKWDVGLELQQTNSNISNYGNRAGIRDTLQVAHSLEAQQHFFFTRFSADIFERLILEAAVSVNYYRYKFGPLNSQNALTNRKFDPQFMPRIALSYQFADNFTGRASVSRGYSTPTIARDSFIKQYR